MRYLLDTCAVLWLAGDEPDLTDGTVAELQLPQNEVFVSAITSAELACLVRKKKIELSAHWRRWFRDAIEKNGWAVLPVDLENIEEAYSLPGEFHSDPADRVLAAAARLNKLTLVTGDQRILDYPHVKAIR
ncbi:MAG: type II toxin-antitoxin system VapC family toxin [Opitutales bacterium]